RASEAAVEVAAAAGEGIRWLKPGEASLEESSDEDSEDHDEEDQADQESKQLAFNRSAVVRQGGKHPDWLTEPAAVAEISLPPLSPDEVVYLPAEVAEKRLLSSPQLESVAYAARRFRAHLPSGVRAGYYLGDGTGCGKGRVIAALVWHLWNSGAKRHVWLSASSDLLEDATRDFCDLGADLPLCTLSSLPYGSISTGPGLDEEGNGIIFASYHLLVASKASASGVPTSENSRLVQLIDWLRRGKGGACGLIALDEAHRTKNVMNSKTSQGSKSGLCALELQRACPLAAVLYASATGATELRHLGYLERLGLWGRGRPHGSFEELRDAVEGGGFAAMELLAMTMRAEGMLSCRSLSFKGASFRLVPVSLESLCNTYSKACDFWQESLKLILRLLKAKTREVKQKRLKHSTELKENPLHLRYFWGAQQQFFRQLLICTKVETAVSLATSAQLRGESVVFAMWSTGEAITEAVANREGDRAAAAAGFASAPKEVALRMLKELRNLAASLESEQGALKEIDRAEQTLEKLELPPNPLDDIMKRLGGPHKVAELTGRTRRLVYNELTGETRFEERGEGANLQELRAFQTGQKHVAIVTEAASAGISLHCDRRLPEDAQRPRYMISIEMPWEADKALQQLGRVHRSNQRVPPRFAFVVTDLGGEVRFVSTVARRLRILGAMMRGDRNSAHGAVQSLATFDIQNRYGRQALARLFELLRSGQEPEVAFSFLQFSDRKSKGSSWRSWADFKKIALKALDLIGLRPDTEDKYEESLAESKNLNVFLNRLLMLEPSIQNALFDAVAELYMHLVDLDRASGAYDGGPEILDRRRGTKAEVRLVHREVLFKDPVTGAETAYARLQLDRGMSWEKANEVLESRQRGRAGFYWCPRAPSPLVLAVPRPRLHGLRAGAASDDDESDADLDLHWPQGPPAEHGWEQHVSSAKLRKGDFFHKAGADELPNVSTIWKRLHGSSADLAGRWEDEHVLTGSILSTWAVLGTAISGASTYSRLKVQRIPLVRAKLPDGGAIVGVRVRHERLQEVRYVLSALHDAKTKTTSENKEADQLGVRKLSAELEAFLRTQPNQSAAWRNWAGAHQVLMANGLIPEGAVGMQQAREAFEDLERNGKVDIQPDSVQLREKPKGSGWYIPPPKKPKAKCRGRGRKR
ncbi:Protein FORGETTER 1 (Protein EMBRYO DEFECTIVE 1135), partial [Durusdinium trenchii]